MNRLRPAFLLLVVVSVVAMPLQAQVGFSKGIKAGFNFAKLRGNDASDASSRSGYQVGLYGSFGVLGMVAIQPEVLYSQKGAKFDEGAIETTYKLDYIEIPLLVKLSFPLQSAATILPLIYAGPTFGFKINAKLKRQGQENGTNIDREEKLEHVKGTDFGLAVGGGVGLGPINIDLRYNFGLGSIDNSEQNLDLKNGVFSISAGLGF